MVSRTAIDHTIKNALKNIKNQTKMMSRYSKQRPGRRLPHWKMSWATDNDHDMSAILTMYFVT